MPLNAKAYHSINCLYNHMNNMFENIKLISINFIFILFGNLKSNFTEKK
jgi:hypothetical protein